MSNGFLTSPLVGQVGPHRRCGPGEGDASADEIADRTPHPALRATFSHKGRREETTARQQHYGSSRSSRACLNHFRNMSSVSIISVKPARLIFTVETIEGGPDSVWP